MKLCFIAIGLILIAPVGKAISFQEMLWISTNDLNYPSYLLNYPISLLVILYLVALLVSH